MTKKATRLYPFISTAALAAVILFAGCAKTPPASVSAAPVASIPTVVALGEEGAAAQALAPSVTTKEILPDAPDFLTADQQDLFRAAQRMYTGFGGSGSGYDRDYRDTIQVEIKGGKLLYCRDKAFASYDAFLRAMHAVFTDAYCETLLPADGFSGLIEHEGKLYAMDVNRGIFAHYVSTSYRLRSETEQEIVFVMEGHYNPTAQDKTPDAAQEYTKDYQVRMERTDMGWRFDNFAVMY